MNRFSLFALCGLLIVSGCGGENSQPEKSEQPVKKTIAEKTLSVEVPQKKKPAKPPLDQRLYGGVKLAEWPARIKNLDPRGAQAQQAVPGLVAIIADEDVPNQLRHYAAITIGQMKAVGQPAVPVFIQLLKKHGTSNTEASRLISAWSIRSLALLGPVAKEATPHLNKLLFDSSRTILIRAACLEALAQIGSANPQAVHSLIRMLSHRFSSKVTRTDANLLRGYTLDGIALVGSPASAGIRSVIRLSQNSNEDIRRKAATALGSMGLAGQDALAPLAEMVAFDDSPAVRDAAAAALAKLGEIALPVMRKLLTDDEATVRARMAKSLGSMGKTAKAALDDLDYALDDDDGWVRLNAAEAIWLITGKTGSVVPALIEELKNPKRRIRFKTYQLFQKLGPKARSAIEPLKKLLTDERAYVRAAAAKVLRTLEVSESPTNQSSAVD